MQEVKALQSKMKQHKIVLSGMKVDSVSAFDLGGDLDKYVFKESIGRGANGSVDLHMNKNDKQDYAIKLIDLQNCSIKEKEDAMNEV
jgi:serine/threonine protein kinase